MWHAHPGKGEIMIRRLLEVSAVLSLFVALLLAVAGLGSWPITSVDIPGTNCNIALWGDEATISRGSAGAVAKVPLTLSSELLALAFALPFLRWATTVVRRERGRRARGFPVEVMGHAPPIEPAVDQGTEATRG